MVIDAIDARGRRYGPTDRWLDGCLAQRLRREQVVPPPTLVPRSRATRSYAIPEAHEL